MGIPLVTVRHGLVSVSMDIGSAEWFTLLDRIDIFAVEAHDISFLVRRMHDGAFALWLAFCSIDNDPRCVVVGSASELTRERLLTAAHQLANWDTVTPEFQVELERESAPMPQLSVTSPDLLVTKLEMPTVTSRTLVRTQAIDRMARALDYPLTVVNSPSGYGKTTLVAAWASETPARVAWLLLDENDNDPVRFSTHLLAALDRVVPGLLTAVLPYVQNAQTHLSDGSLISRLINSLTSTDGHIALVLDGYHTISQDNAVIQNAMNYFIENLPPHVHVIVLTRTSVPLRLPWLRVAGRLFELRIDDLRFTEDEARVFLERRTGSDVAPEVSARIHRRTEGWVAGLQLAAFALEDSRTPAENVADLLSENRNVVDFIAEEVLTRLPHAVSENVLWMAALDRFNVALCDALPGIVDSQTTLETLERENAFLVPVDDPSGWYRFHRLFREVLWKRLQRTHKEELAEMHRQVSAWYEAHGMTRDAVHYALHASDEHAVLRIVRELANRVFESGSSPSDLRALAQCLDLLPADMIQKHPQLCLIEAQMFVQSGDLDEAELWLEAADTHISQDMTVDGETAASGDHMRMRDEIMQVRGIIARLRKGSPPADGWQSALMHAPHASHSSHAWEPQAAMLSTLSISSVSSVPPRAQRMPQRTDAHHSSTVPGPLVIYERVTAREKEVLVLLAKGEPNQVIADDLTIAVATVKRHLSNLYRKLQVDNRTQAVWRAWTLGLLDDLPADGADTLAPHSDRTKPDERGAGMSMPRWNNFPNSNGNGNLPPGITPG